MNTVSSLATPVTYSPSLTAAPKANDKTADAAKQFEGVFLSEMMSHMFEGQEPDGEFGGGQGEKMFSGLLVNEYGKAMANAGGIGIADQLQKAMIQMQQHKG